MGASVKKPKIKDFKRACDATKGDLTKMAVAFDVTRRTVRNWCNADAKFQEALDEYRGRSLDECLNRAKQLALGIPKIVEKDGKPIIAGWIEKPDGYMLRYLIGKLGKDEGYGDSIDVTSKGESIKSEPYVIRVISEIKEDLTKEPEEIAVFDK